LAEMTACRTRKITIQTRNRFIILPQTVVSILLN
jgi:hypothetical protein